MTETVGWIEGGLDAFWRWMVELGLPAPAANVMIALSGILVLLVAGYLLRVLAHGFLQTVLGRIIRKSRIEWDDALLDEGVMRRLSHLAPALLVYWLAPVVLADYPWLTEAAEKFVGLYIVVIVLMVLDAFLNAVARIARSRPRVRRIPIRGFIQAVKLVLLIFGVVLMLSIAFGQAPGYFLSGLGALTAILLLIFKDAILGLVAGVQVSVNNIVQVGDWISMPNHGADGTVIDVTLTTVKVQNWDKTITNIPSYAMISESLTNWRGMQESGGRRIKRAIYLDMQSIGFLDDALHERLHGIALLQTYLDGKETELEEDRTRRGLEKGQEGLNGRRLTNLGTFRAYCAAYLRSRSDIRQDMTFLVRQLDPTPQGLPLEIYVFTNDTEWAPYEGIQSDIFEHLLASVPEFGLRVFQQPSGQDVQALRSVVR